MAQPTNVFNGQYTAPQQQPQQNQYMNIQDLIIQIKDYEIKELKMRQEIDKLRQDNNKLKAMVKKLQKQQ
jgi:cell division protein FtsB